MEAQAERSQAFYRQQDRKLVAQRYGERWATAEYNETRKDALTEVFPGTWLEALDFIPHQLDWEDRLELSDDLLHSAALKWDALRKSRP